MASTDAKPVPQKNVAYRVTFPILDADGDLVTGATGLDSEISKDAGTFADCTNEATEIATSSGMYYLDLTSTEMNADCVCIIVKTSSSGAKTTPIILYPEEAGDIRVNVTQFGGSNGTFSSGRPEVNMTHAAGTAWASGAIVSGAFASGAIGAGAIATDAIGAAELAADAVTEIAGGVWDLATTGHTTASTFGAQLKTLLDTIASYLDTEIAAIKTKTDSLTFTVAGDLDVNVQSWKDSTAPAMTGDAFARLGAPAGASVSADIAAVQADTDNIQTRIPAALVSGRIDASVGAMANDVLTAAAIATDAIDADALAASGVAEIADGVWDEATSGHSTGGTTGAAIIAAGSAGDPWSSSLPGAYTAGSAGYIIGNNLDAAVSSRASQSSVDTIDDFLDTEIAAIKAKTDNLPSDPADASDISTAFSGVTSTLSTIAGYLDTEIAAIKAKTDNLPSDPADASVIAARFDTLDTAVSPISSINTNVGTLLTDVGVIDDLIDTEVAAIKAKTDNLPSDPADASVIAGRFDDIDAKIADIWQNFGLDISNPLTITPSSRVAGDVDLTLSGDGITSKVVTRNP